MGEVDFSLGLTAGAFLLAGWVDARFAASRPVSPRRRAVHALVGVVLIQISVGALYLVRAAGAPPAGLMAATFALFLPALVYAMLTGLWMLRMLADLVGAARR